jgi:hypothetical protein
MDNRLKEYTQTNFLLRLSRGFINRLRPVYIRDITSLYSIVLWGRHGFDGQNRVGLRACSGWQRDHLNSSVQFLIGNDYALAA